MRQERAALAFNIPEIGRASPAETAVRTVPAVEEVVVCVAPQQVAEERELTLPDDRVLAHHAAVAVARTCRRSGWRIDRARKEDRIDLLVALAMALDRREHAPQPAKLLGWV